MIQCAEDGSKNNAASLLHNSTTETTISANPPDATNTEELTPSHLRYLILVLFSLLTSALVISCEQPLPLHTEFLRDLGITNTQYTILVSCYTFPNIIFPIIGGWIFDTLGRGWCLVLFSSASLIGQLVIAIGGSANSYSIILAGRLINSCGGENLNVTIAGYLYYWFHGKNMGMPMAILGVVGLLTSAGCYALTPILYNIRHALGLPLWLSFIYCSFAVFLGLAAGVITIRAERKGIVKRQEREENASIFSIFQLSNYKPVFWFLVATAFCFFGTVFSVMAIGTGFIEAKYGFDNVTAGVMLAIPQLSVLVLFPFFGKFVDKYGTLSTNLIASATLLLSSMLYFTLSPPCKGCYSVLAGCFMFGIGFSLYFPTLWASPVVIVKKQAIGTSYGYLESARNLGVSIISISSGVILDRAKGYSSVMFFFSGIGAMTLVVTVGLTIFDCQYGTYLHNAFRTRVAQ